jgi:uncharacterized protein YbaR (Trm112 family)
MKQSLVAILVCPVCKGDLKLKIDEEDGGEITRGSLRCDRCQVDYPIEDGIPDLLPPEKPKS